MITSKEKKWDVNLNNDHALQVRNGGGVLTRGDEKAFLCFIFIHVAIYLFINLCIDSYTYSFIHSLLLLYLLIYLLFPFFFSPISWIAMSKVCYF